MHRQSVSIDNHVLCGTVVVTELLNPAAGLLHLLCRDCQHHTEIAWVLETLQTRHRVTSL